MPASRISSDVMRSIRACASCPAARFSRSACHASTVPSKAVRRRFSKKISREATSRTNMRSWLTNRSVPSYRRSTRSSASRLKTSRWFVGSSRIRKFASETKSDARLVLARSPPDKTFTGLNTSSARMFRFASTVRTSDSGKTLARMTFSSTVFSVSSTSSWFWPK